MICVLLCVWKSGGVRGCILCCLWLFWWSCPPPLHFVYVVLFLGNLWKCGGDRSLILFRGFVVVDKDVVVVAMFPFAVLFQNRLFLWASIKGRYNAFLRLETAGQCVGHIGQCVCFMLTPVSIQVSVLLMLTLRNEICSVSIVVFMRVCWWFRWLEVLLGYHNFGTSIYAVYVKFIVL